MGPKNGCGFCVGFKIDAYLNPPMAIALLNWTDGVCWVDGRYDESRELSIKLRNFNQESAFYAFTVAMEIFGESDFSFNKIIFY